MALRNTSSSWCESIAARELTCFFDDDGMLVLRGRMTPEDGAVFMQAMDAMVEAMVTTQNPPVSHDDNSATCPKKRFSRNVLMHRLQQPARRV